ncbi:hypothetical protein [Nocardia huaxiensis]|uniref:hypothetical protein n=1 Tax=Nocardia huaxiensis TaxID=2755382 RepID=UPI001E43E1D0|nr:hypothetical protein [Nocardia huaxiensis]UFS96895.1 hypothetical protein LPY97_02885 [Nocardia huaxiensis]
MNTRHTFRRRLVLWCLVPLGLATGLLVAPTAHADADYGGGCVLFTGNRAATIDSLRFRCAPWQQEAIYRDAPRGNVPMGVKDGWVASPPFWQAVAPAIWIGKTFYTGPDGGHLLNRITRAGIEGWPADVYTAPSVVDGGPAWALDYRPSPSPWLYDEIREVTPGVWFGYSFSREGGGVAQILTFILG